MSFPSLECNSLVVNNNLAVYDSSGRKVFWVGDNGANIKELHKSIELDDIIDFPEFRDGLLTCKLNKLKWSKDLSLNDITANDITLDSLNSKKVKSDYIETITFKGESVVSKSLLTDIATATDGKITNLTNDKLTSKSITADDVKAGKLECDEFKPKEVETDNLLSKQINTEEFNSVSLQSINAGIVNLEAQNVLTQKMDIIETANDITLDLLNSKKVKSDYIETITFKSESVVLKSLLTDIATATDGKITNLTNDKLTSKLIKADDVKAGKLECDEFRPKEVETDNLLSKQINTEEFNSVSLQSINAGIVNLEAQNVLTQKMDIIESANVKLLNNEEGHIQKLNVGSINIDNLKYNKIVNYVKEFGSLEEPLELNNINIKQLDCNNELGSLKIFNKIHNKIPNNRFELINIPDTDYSITTILHNQFMNANYNFSKINGRTYLMCDFNKEPENLIVELILNKL